jgi:hypothetical protein
MFRSRHRVEDPARIASFIRALAPLDWSAKGYKASLDVLFLELGKLADAEIRYYYGRRVVSRRVSTVCRFLAWLFGSVGILVPLLKPVLGERVPAEFLSWGYVAFGMAGAVLIFDAVFSGTRAHQRCTATQLELEKIHTIFSIEWQARTVKFVAEPTPAAVLDLVERAVAFASELHRVLGTETSAWQEAVNEAMGDIKGKIASGGGG